MSKLKKIGFGYLAFMCGTTAIAGINAFFRDFSADMSKAFPNLVLGLICALLTFLCVRKGFGSKKQPSPKSRAKIPDYSVSKDRKATGSAMESRLSHMPSESITVEARSIDPGEDAITPKGAKISYLDAQALNFWDGRQTDFEIPAHYSESAFGRNVGPALKRLLHDGYLGIGDIVESINLKKVPELKAILADRGLKISGNKPELIQCLISNLDPDELNVLFPVSVYHVTEKGNSALEPYSILFDNQSHTLGFSTYRLLQEKQQNEKSTNEEIFTKLLLTDLNKAARNGNETEYQRLASKSAQYFRECGRYEYALEYNILAYFMWFHVTEKYAAIWNSGSSGYLAMSIDSDGQKCGLTFNQLVSFFAETLRKHNPFGLCTRQNIQKAVDSFKKSISMQ